MQTREGNLHGRGKRRRKKGITNLQPVQKGMRQKKSIFLVDGYNIIYAWPELKKLADENLDGARMKLLDMLSNYQWIRRCHVIVVFDAYRVEGHKEEIIDYYNIHVVYTREAQQRISILRNLPMKTVKTMISLLPHPTDCSR